MPVVQPYSDILIVKDYCRKVGNITDATYIKEQERADSKVEAGLGLDLNEHIDNGYTYYKMVSLVCEKLAACEIQKMYGDPADAEIICAGAKEDLDMLIAADAKLEPSLQDLGDIGSVEAPLPKTYPSNPEGHRLIGRPNTKFEQGYF
ncbi:MAG TPA: hypothetical protein VL854_06260 [Nitrososphaeraceae archaeon]|nr:hypothetical protein [Nitrososphaeraceae archaeon]